MEIINLKRIWEIFQIIDRIDEDEVLDFNNASLEYESFLEWYSFKIIRDSIMVFNDDRVPYEDYTWNEFNYIPFSVMNMSDEGVEKWVIEEINKKEEEYVEREQSRKETLLQEIERIKKILKRDFGIEFEYRIKQLGILL